MTDAFDQRRSGILLHPTSLPSPFGIGDLGTEAYRFIDFLHRTGQTVWQLLPLGPTGYGDSPYSAYSAFAGNPLLIDLRQLVEVGELSPVDLPEAQPVAGRIDYDRVRQQTGQRLEIAATTFFAQPRGRRHQAFDQFCQKNADWLENYALFVALQHEFEGEHWNRWPRDIRLRKPDAIQHWRETLASQIERQRYQQFVFFDQWSRLRHYANERGILLLGDIPIFVADNSADVWSRPELFKLESDGKPSLVAGVPPDYFSETGQRWGNPLFDWQQMTEENFAWWKRRVHVNLTLFDLVRIDHFRGFAACWEIPADEPTAIGGSWVPTAGRALLTELKKDLGKLPIVAEDLGVITPDVEALRTDFELPGMKILHFAFDSGPKNPYLPHNLSEQSVVYTGTHDNNTTVGWWNGLGAEQRRNVEQYLGYGIEQPSWPMIRTALASISRLAILPMQDVLGLDGSSRMNIPGQAEGNWGWRMNEGDMNPPQEQTLSELTRLYGRKPSP